MGEIQTHKSYKIYVHVHTHERERVNRDLASFDCIPSFLFFGVPSFFYDANHLE